MTELEIAVVGVGRMGTNHARVLSEMDGVRLKAVCDMDRDAAERLARRYLVPSVYTEIEDMLSPESLDGVVISTPTNEHLRAAEKCFKRKKHVLVEKPLAPSVAECQTLLASARDAGVKRIVYLGGESSEDIRDFGRQRSDDRFGNVQRLPKNCEV